MRFLSFLACAFTVFNLNAIEIAIDEFIISFDDNQQKVENIQVTNLSNELGYVALELYEIFNAGTDLERKIIYMQNDPSTEEGKKIQEKFKHQNIEIVNPENSGLFFSPQKMVIDASSTGNNFANVRVINMNEKIDVEKVYRIRTSPVIADFETGESKMGIKILMAYETLIFVQPDNPIEQYELRRDKDKLYITNTGNVNVFFKTPELCYKNDCEKSNSFRVYPNQTKEIILKEADKKLTFKTIEKYGNSSKLVEHNI